MEAHHHCGRLTLATNDPVPTSNIAVSSVVYFTPYKGNRISLYVPGYGWRVHTFAELSLDVSGYTINKNYDVFIYDNAGTLTLEGVEWSNATLRAVALVSQDGRWVKNGYTNKLYLGTIRCNGVGQTADTYLARLCWNNYNRTPRQLRILETANSWTYNSADFRPFNNNGANQIEYVVGLVEDMLQLVCTASATYTGAGYTAALGIGVDSQSVSTPTVATFALQNTQLGSIPTGCFQRLPIPGLSLSVHAGSVSHQLIGHHFLWRQQPFLSTIRRFRMDPRINVSKLHQELAAAKLPVVSVHSDGRMDYSRALSKAEEAAAQRVIEAHDPAVVPIPTTDDLVRALWSKVIKDDPTKADELMEQFPDVQF